MCSSFTSLLELGAGLGMSREAQVLVTRLGMFDPRHLVDRGQPLLSPDLRLCFMQRHNCFEAVSVHSDRAVERFASAIVSCPHHTALSRSQDQMFRARK